MDPRESEGPRKRETGDQSRCAIGRQKLLIQGRGHEPRNAGGLCGLDDARGQILLSGLQREAALLAL